MNEASLLEIIRRFYPRGMETTSPGYDDTEERRRQVDATRRAVAEHAKWSAMLDRLRARFQVQELSLHILAGGFDSAYSAKIAIPGADERALGFHVSFLGPYYVIHRTGAPGEEPCARGIAEEIEATYGYEPIPPEIGSVVVPDVALDTVALGEATIYDCLLSAVWGR
jgi:hypothetical protein